MAAKKEPPGRIVVQNRRARHDYEILERVEAGLALLGTEVKSLRAGHGSLVDAYAQDRDGELYLMNAHIPPYAAGGIANHEPLRPRKLLLHRREINRMIGAIARKGVTVVPLDIHLNDKGRAKVTLALAVGRRRHDKRAAVKEREWKREQGRLLRERS
jgi:SsrA-binding protein